MSDSSKEPVDQGPDPAPPLRENPPGTSAANGLEAKPDAQQGNHAVIPVGDRLRPIEYPPDIQRLRLEKTHLPPELKEQILAELPPPEEIERMYREIQENGGLSAEEFFASLGLDAEPQS
jgi:hypothetical protein